MGRNCLVTGGAGFIGSNLAAALLERGDSVRVVDDFSTGKRENLEGLGDRIELIEGSLVDPDVCRRVVADVEFVFHEAALPSVQRSVDDPVGSDRANVGATVQLLSAARDAGVRRVIFAASSSAYGDIDVPAKSEDLPPRPMSPYAVTKLTGEYYCSVFHDCYGMETVCLRYFNVFGPNQDPSSPYSAVIPLFVTAVLDGRQPTIYGDGLQSRDFSHVANVVHGNLLACEAPPHALGAVINVACGQSTDLLQLLAIIGRILDKTVEPQFAPPRAGDVRHSLADLTRARELLGYEPVVSLEDGLRNTIEWYRSHRDRW